MFYVRILRLRHFEYEYGPRRRVSVVRTILRLKLSSRTISRFQAKQISNFAEKKEKESMDRKRWIEGMDNRTVATPVSLHEFFQLLQATYVLQSPKLC